MTRLPKHTRTLRLGVALALAAVLLLLAAPASAQFGKNRVNYRDFGEWKLYHSPHFNVHYYEAEAHLLEKTVSFAESAYDELSRLFDFQIQDPTPLIVYATHSAFLQNNIILNGVPEGAQAFATPSRFRMVLPLDLPDPDLLSLIRHELTHIFQYHILFRGRLGRSLRSGPPQWFIEGMASYFGQDESPAEKKFIRDAVVNDRIPPISAQGGGYFAYRFGHAVFEFIEERWGKESVVDLLYEARNTLGGNIGRAIERVFRMDEEDFNDELRRWLRKQYLAELLETGEPSDFGRPFRLEPNVRGQEISPVASPSGDLVASITTDKQELDISIFDAKKRRRIRVLTKGLDKQINRFVVGNTTQVGSDLAFSPDGNFIAVFGTREGFNSLVLVDVIRGGIHKIIDMEVEQARAPAWNPDNSSVVFSGNLNGQYDLFSVDLDSYAISNVTNDEAFDTAPAFSRDGKWLAYTTFVGERSQIFRLDPRDPSQRFALTAGESNNKEPVFSPDGNRVYFTSDRSGVDNIWGLDLEKRTLSQYTNVVTSCDKPTILALPEGGERLVYNGYWKGGFDLYMTDVEEPVGEAIAADFEESTPAVVAELPRFEPDIEVAIDDSNIDKYRGFKFFLDDATTFAGLSSNNIFVSNVLLTFSDYLGDRRIFTSISAIDQFSNFNAQYVDLSRRWQWSARIFDTRFFATGFDLNNEFVRDQVYQTSGLEGSIIYPLSRKNRLEFSAGFNFRKYEFNSFAIDTAGDVFQALEPRNDEYPQIAASFVSDSAIFNQWGAISGHRIRIGGSYAPDLDESGALQSTVFLDARKYIPITRRSNFAFRLFVADSSGNFPNPTYVGGLDTIRGYDFRFFGGHRAFYANVEYRFPLIDQLAFPILRFQGIRGVVFFDIGGAWFPSSTGIDVPDVVDVGSDEFEDIVRGVNLQGPRVDTDFDCFDNNSTGSGLGGCVASYGYGITLRFLGFNLNFDFAKRYDLDTTLSDFVSAFWIGTRF